MRRCGAIISMHSHGVDFAALALVGLGLVAYEQMSLSAEEQTRDRAKGVLSETGNDASDMTVPRPLERRLYLNKPFPFNLFATDTPCVNFQSPFAYLTWYFASQKSQRPTALPFHLSLTFISPCMPTT